MESSPSIAEDGTVYIGSSYEMGRGYLHAFGPIYSNTPPDLPRISGPTNGRAGEEYIYWIAADDPDNNPVRLYIEWGDGTSTGWTREYASGESYYFKHTWTEQGHYTIKVKAKDVMDEESDWKYLDVTMPKNKMMWQSPFWYKILERFPLIQKLLLLIH